MKVLQGHCNRGAALLNGSLPAAARQARSSGQLRLRAPRNQSGAVLLAALVMLVSGPARAIWADGSGALDVGASLRTITGLSYNYRFAPLFGADNRSDAFSQTLLRLEIHGEPLSWLRYELHGVGEMYFDNANNIAAPGLLAAPVQALPYRALDAEWRFGEQDVRGRLWLDRCNVTFAAGPVDVTVGRQAVSFGKAWFWSPLDVFLAFDPRQFDRDYKPGVDALKVDLELGTAAGLNLVAALGRDTRAAGGYSSSARADASWNGTALLLRAFANFWGFDFSAQGGKIYGGYTAGAGAAGELLDLSLRAELSWFQAEDDSELSLPLAGRRFSSHLAAVVGAGHRFESSLDVELEYLYNGAGEPGDLTKGFARVLAGDSFHAGRHLLGLAASYEILPILQGSLAWIFSASDLSSLLVPSLSLSVSDEADFLAGAMIALGKRPRGSGALDLELRSEFGTYPNFYYLEFKFYL